MKKKLAETGNRDQSYKGMILSLDPNTGQQEKHPRERIDSLTIERAANDGHSLQIAADVS